MHLPKPGAWHFLTVQVLPVRSGNFALGSAHRMIGQWRGHTHSHQILDSYQPPHPVLLGTPTWYLPLQQRPPLGDHTRLLARWQTGIRIFGRTFLLRRVRIALSYRSSIELPVEHLRNASLVLPLSSTMRDSLEKNRSPIWPLSPAKSDSVNCTF